MLHHYIVGVGAFVLLSIAWLGVQRAWSRAFPDTGDEPDALAGRPGCFGCARVQTCTRQPGGSSCSSRPSTQTNSPTNISETQEKMP